MGVHRPNVLYLAGYGGGIGRYIDSNVCARRVIMACEGAFMMRRLIAVAMVLVITLSNWIMAARIVDKPGELAKTMFLDSALPVALIAAITI